MTSSEVVGVTKGISRISVNETGKVDKRRENVTAQLFAATRALKVGQVIRAPDFSFLDALAALEILDPKTDSGMVITEEDDFDITCIQSLLPEEVVWIIDQLLAREISWHSGNPLAQTLFTCTYLAESLFNFDGSLDTATFCKPSKTDKPKFEENLVRVVLRNYVLAVVKNCSWIREELKKGNIYDEEDASINTASLSMLDEIETPKFLELLDQALHIINAELEKSPSKALEAIETRLTLRKQFLEIVAEIGMPPKKRHHALENCQSLLVKIVESMELGKPSAGAFSTRIQRSLSISVPPRPMVSIDPKEAAKGMKSILDNLLEMDDIQEYRAPHELLNFFAYFAAREPLTLAYIRSLLQTKFIVDDTVLSKESCDSFLMSCMIEICQPQPEYYLDKNPQSLHPNSQKFKVQQLIQTFLDKSTPLFMDLFRIKCHNRSRQRRNLSKLVQEWESLQLDIEKIDMDLLELIPQKPIARDEEGGPKYAFPLCSWVYHMKFNVVESILFMGFGLELYQPYEYVLIYSYLAHSYLLHSQQLERVKSHAYIPKRRKNQNKEPPYIDFLILRNEVFEVMCKAYCSLFMVLETLGLIQLPARDKTTEYMRYTQRLKPFWGLSSPEVLPFDKFKEMATIPKSRTIMSATLQSAMENLAIAKQSIDSLLKMTPDQTRMRYCFPEFTLDIKNLLKSCIGLNIFIQGLLRQIYTDMNVYANKTIVIEFKYHANFGMVRIVDRKSRR